MNDNRESLVDDSTEANIDVSSDKKVFPLAIILFGFFMTALLGIAVDGFGIEKNYFIKIVIMTPLLLSGIVLIPQIRKTRKNKS